MISLTEAKKYLGIKSFFRTLDNKFSQWYWQWPSKEDKEQKDPVKQSVDEQLRRPKKLLRQWFSRRTL